MKRYCNFILIIVLFSCGKADRDLDISNYDAADNAFAELAFGDVFTMVMLATEDQSGLRSGMSISCAAISVDTTGALKTLLLDFGTTNCTGTDGRKRRGIIYATFTGNYRDSLSVINLSSGNFYLNDYKIEVNKIITNKGRNSLGNYWFSVITQNAKITSPDQNYFITYTANQQFEWISGFSTFIVSDDEYKISGTAEGRGQKGNQFYVKITDPLLQKINCGIPVSGKATVEPENLSPRYVNYGSGSCDNSITVTLNGEELTITVE